MRKIIQLAIFVLVGTTSAHAQEIRKAEFSASYSFLRQGGSNGINSNGGSFSLASNLNHWAGIAGDFGVYHASPFGVGLNTYTYLIGPRFTYRKPAGIHPFAQILFGGAHLRASSGGASGTANGFTYSAGGGVDLGFSRHVALRPQIDYIGIRSNGSTLNNLRASFGIVFRFGER